MTRLMLIQFQLVDVERIDANGIAAAGFRGMERIRRGLEIERSRRFGLDVFATEQLPGQRESSRFFVNADTTSVRVNWLKIARAINLNTGSQTAVLPAVKGYFVHS